MSMSDLLPSSRIFKVWEYQVSHGQLLVRSPKAPATSSVLEQVTNVDLVFHGVEYMALPRLMRGLELVKPTLDEVKALEAILDCSIEKDGIIIIHSNGQRFPVVASGVSISENTWDIFESPIEFRSQFRNENSEDI